MNYNLRIQSLKTFAMLRNSYNDTNIQFLSKRYNPLRTQKQV